MANVSKKTSGRYRMVCLNGSRKVATIVCDPGTGKILAPTGKKIVGADLETLDIYILEKFKNKEELFSYLKALGYPVSMSDTCCFSYQHNKATRYLELVYGNQELHDLAILCKQYKKRFSEYLVRNNISSKELRKLVSSQISREKIWKDFYNSLLSYIHDPDFYAYLAENNLLGERAFGFIYDYLRNESCLDREQQDAFRSAEYYLIDTFTAYKPIRGMIVSKNSYNCMLRSVIASVCPERKINYFASINPFDLISEVQLCYLEDHSYFSSLSKIEKEDFILSILGITLVPWYERTLTPITQEQIDALEKQPGFLELTYLKKIRSANKLLESKMNSSKGQSSYQKKKV